MCSGGGTGDVYEKLLFWRANGEKIFIQANNTLNHPILVLKQ